MAPMQPIPTPEQSLRKGLSWPDVQALGLVLLILMVINLPLYQSVLQGQEKSAPAQIAATHTAPIRTAFAKTLSIDAFKTNVSSLTKTSGASNSNRAR